MRVLRRSISIPLLGALAFASCTAGSVSKGIAAFTVNGHEVSQHTIDDELQVLAESSVLRELVFQQSQGQEQISRTPGSITTANAAGWVSRAISHEVAREEVARRGVRVTDEDRQLGEEIARQSVGGAPVFDTLPKWFQRLTTRRWANVAALQRVLLASPAELATVLEERCPSGRYLSVIIVETQADVDALAAQLAFGGDFAQLATQQSLHDSGPEGGVLGCADEMQQLPDAVAAAADSQAPETVSAPIALDQGFLVLRVSTTAPAGLVEGATLEAIIGRSREAEVEVDPRYGTWDAKTGQVIPPVAPGAPQPQL